MISLRSAMRAAMENDHEFRGDFHGGTVIEPFEDIAGEDPMDKFEFELPDVAEVVALESYRPYSRRHRTEGITRMALEEASAGFWALLAVAVAAAIAMIIKMVSWFTGGSSAGGAGGGGGGGGAIAKVEEKAKRAVTKAEVSRQHFKAILAYAR